MTFWTAHKIIQAMQSTLIFINMRPYDRAQEMHVTEAYGLIKKFTDALEKDLLANRQKYAEVAQEIGGDCTVILKESLHPHIFAAYLGFHLRDMINTHPPLRTETNLSTLFDLVEMQLDCNGTD
ncbi:MAG: hypothetical protein KKA31_05425 [Candidatus Margulisbacteria bacterium]|nr:hypothetical protein [Candidatus Margulisiibacteriota bacterium]